MVKIQLLTRRCFVAFSSEEARQKAIALANGQTIGDRQITVKAKNYENTNKTSIESNPEEIKRLVIVKKPSGARTVINQLP